MFYFLRRGLGGWGGEGGWAKMREGEGEREDGGREGRVFMEEVSVVEV